MDITCCNHYWMFNGPRNSLVYRPVDMENSMANNWIPTQTHIYTCEVVI
jgi:hypothetical protein